MKIINILFFFISRAAFSQEKCVDFFSTKSEAQIQTKLEALVLLNYQIEQNTFENGNQLLQANEYLHK